MIDRPIQVFAGPITRGRGRRMMMKRPREGEVVASISCTLSTASGFGDRLLDAFAACAIGRLLGRHLELYVLSQGLSYQGFVGDYDWESIALPDCTALPGSEKLSGFAVTPHSHFGVRGDRLVLRHARRWATTTVRELVAEGHIKVVYCPTADNRADALTKSLIGQKQM